MKNESNEQMDKRTIWSVMKDSKLRLPLILVCSLQGGQQLAGINAVCTLYIECSVTANYK